MFPKHFFNTLAAAWAVHATLNQTPGYNIEMLAGGENPGALHTQQALIEEVFSENSRVSPRYHVRERP